MNSRAQKREQAKKKRRTVLVSVVALALFYLMLSFFLGEKGLLRYLHLRQQEATLKADVVTLRSSNEALRQKVDALKTDPQYIEQLAREQGMVKEGETVYQYEDGK